MPNNPVPNNEEDQPDFEQLDGLFDESLPEAGGPADSQDDPLGSLGSLDLDPLSEGGPGFPEDAADQDGEPDAEPSGKKSKKGKKKKKVKAKKKKAPKKEKVPKEKGEGVGLLQSLGETSPYTVMLGLSFLAIVIAILCLLKELRDYDLDIGAEGYKQQACLDPGFRLDADDLGATHREAAHIA